MELPHLDVLHRDVGAQRHANAIARADVRIGGRCVDAPCSARGKHRGLGFHVDRFTGLHADGDHPDHGAVLVAHQVHCEPLIQEYGLGLQVGLIQRVQQRVAGSVCSRAGTRGLAAFAEVFRLTTKGPLIDATTLCSRKWQAHVLQLEHGLRTHAAHVLDGILIADVVRPLHGVVHVPAPIVIRVVGRDGTGNAALRRDSVRAGGKHL